MVENITKLDVARRQLKEAIWLFFYEHDAISIHTLAAAAHQVLHDLAKGKGIEDIKNCPFIREEKRKYWIKKLHGAQNYFKHADEDPERTFEFHPDLTQGFLIDALHLYQQLTQSLFPEGIIYSMWFAQKYPDTFEEGALKSLICGALGHDWDFNLDDFITIRWVLAALRKNS